MRCSSCGSSNHKKVGDDYVCQHCSSKTTATKDSYSKGFLLIFVIVLVAIIALFQKQENKIPTQASQVKKTEASTEDRKNSITVNNSQGQIGTQIIKTDSDNIDINVDNSQAQINTQMIEQRKDDSTSQEHINMLKTKKEMNKMGAMIEKAGAGGKIDYCKKNAKLKSVSYIKTSKDGKVLESFSNEYSKNISQANSPHVTSTNNGYVIDNENKNYEKQEAYFHQEKQSKFLTVETKH